MLQTSHMRTTRTLASQCSQLINKKKFHQTEAIHYHRLFNDSVPPPDFDNPDIIILHPLTPLQEFWQQMAQYHKAEMFKLEFEINELCAA